MAKLGKLSVKALQKDARDYAESGATKPKRLGDGGGLYCEIAPNGRKKWIYRFTIAGKTTEIGLGGDDTTLAEAREKAAAARKLSQAGIDPRTARQETRTTPTFGEVADAYVKAKTSQWTNVRHAGEWQRTLTEHCSAIRHMPVDRVDTAAVLSVLRPIWSRIPQTSSRLRGRIETVLDSARAQGHIGQDVPNPARWRGHLALLLAKTPTLTRGHHPALPYQEVPDFIARVRRREGVAALVVEFIILTAVRLNEASAARWSEINLESRLWTIPAKRMKARVEHVVPLSPRAVEILETMSAVRSNEFAFPGLRHADHIADRAVTSVVEKMRTKGETLHGFRSSFRDWAGDETDFDRETVEFALSHKVGNVVEQTYRREKALKKRRRLMDAWADYCEPKAV